MHEMALGDLCSLIVDSEHKTAPKEPAGFHPLIRTTDLGLARADFSGAQRVSSNTYAIWTKRAVPLAGDLILAREAPVGGIVEVPDGLEPVLGQRTVLLRPDPGRVDSGFLMYRLASADMQARMAEMSTGSTVPHLNMADIRAFPVPPLPSKSAQRRIAAVLSAFDELIEINERRTELLEELARSLYREWFVHFRFPGHEDVALVDSGLGPIPEGWKIQPVGEALEVLGGGTPSKKCAEYWTEGSIPWFTPSDLTRTRRRFVADSSLRITEIGLAKSSARLFPARSVLMTNRATLGVLAVNTRPAACNQGFIVIPPVPGIAPAFVYEWLGDKAADLERIATGATFKEITKGAFKRVPFLLPLPATLGAFGQISESIDQEVAALEATSDKLAHTRDLLLPRLVTGRMDVSDIDLGALTPTDPE